MCILYTTSENISREVKKKMKRIVFRGMATALVTPFCDGKIDYRTLNELIEEQIAAGIDALVIGGTTGEAAVLSDAERYALYTRAIDRIAGRSKVILGTGTNDTRVAISHTKHASELGCDGVLVVTPYYNKGTAEGVTRHFLSIADESEVPVLLYNVPSRTGVNLSVEVLARLAEHPQIVGIKEASDSVERLVDLAAFGERLALYAGNDTQIFPTLALGGLGAISVLSNLLPREMKEIPALFSAGKTEEARSAQLTFLPLMRAMFLETNPAPVKYAMGLQGKCRPEVRLPLSLPSEKTRQVILAELGRAGLIC